MEQTAENPAQDFLDEEVPQPCRHLLPSALRRAYGAASRVIEAEAFLQTPGGKLQRGDLIAHATEFELHKLVKSGELPFDASWEPYARPTGKHLVVWTKRGKLTVNQVDDWRKRPRDAEFRSNYAVSNMQYLFRQMNEEAKANSARKHLLLLHGYQELNFCYLTVPHSEKNFHLARSTNLMATLHVATPDRAKEEGPTQSPDPEALDNLRKLIRDANDD